MNSFVAVLLPIIIIMASAAVCFAVGRFSEKLRDIIASAVSLAVTVYYGAALFADLRFTLELGTFYHMELGGFHTLYAFIASLMWFVSTVFAVPYFKSYGERSRYTLFSLLTFAGTAGVFLSSSLLTLFIFFEIMSFCSYVMVAHDRKSETLSAASTYLTVSVVGGMALLLGILLFPDTPETGTAVAVSAVLMLVGFGAKAGLFPLHIWLPKAHPAAPAPASALLSGVLTKTGIYGMLLLTPTLAPIWRGWGKLLLSLGVITMVLGGVLALLSTNIKRTLACSSMSQIGFIVVGIAMLSLSGGEDPFAAAGTVLHMVNHSLIKLVLFICAGIVFMSLHSLELNDIRGFGRGKPLFLVAFLLGALDICGIPPFGGYISKTLLHESIFAFVYEFEGIGFVAAKLCEYLFLLTGAMTVAYMTKLFVCLFVMKPSDKVKEHSYVKPPLYVTIPLLLCAVVLPLLGTVRPLIYKIADYGSAFTAAPPLYDNLNFFSLDNLSGSAISIVVGVLIYTFTVRKQMIKDGLFVSFTDSRFDLDDRVYKPLVFKVLPSVFGCICHAVAALPDGLLYLLRKTAYREVEPKKPDFHSALIKSKIGIKLERLSELMGVRHEKRKNLALRFAAAVTSVSLTLRKITRNLSFAMIVACIGLCAALIFLFFYSF